MEYRSSSTVYKKHSNARSFNDKSSYDGVFSAQSKHGASVFSSRVEDYREIFGGSRVSSIPILDFPALNERKLPVDVRSSKLEYSSIFGGCDELNFALPYEELLAESKKTNSFSEQTRTSAGRETPATENPSEYVKGNNLSTQEESCQSFDRMEKISMSYQKLNQGNINAANGTTHVAFLHAVPGFTCMIDERTPVQMCGADTPTSEKLNDICLKNNENKVENKPELPIPSFGESEQTFRSTDCTESQNRGRSDSVDKFFNACERDQGAQHPVIPPKCNVLPKFGINGISERTMGFKSEAFEDSEDAGIDCSSPYSEEEVDVNSVAAASVAALRKAIDAAQASMKIAKESMERRKARPQKHKKMRSGRVLNSDEGREVGTINNSITCKEKKAGKTNGEVEPLEQAFAERREQNSTREWPVTPRVMRDNLNAVDTSSMEFKSLKVDCREVEAKELGEAEQFYEPNSLGKDVAKEPECEKEENADEYEQKGNNGLNETYETPGDNLVEVKGTNEREESGINLSVMKGIILSRLKAVLGVAERENEIKSDQAEQETEIKAETFAEQEKCVKLPEFQVTNEADEKLVIREMGDNNNMESQVEGHKWVEEEAWKIHHQEENEMAAKIVQTEKDAENKLDKFIGQERIVNSIHDFHDGEEAESLKENGEFKGNKELQENRETDEMIDGLSFHLYNNENGHFIFEQTKTDEFREYENMMKATPDDLYIENKLELADGLCTQHKCDNLFEDQKASNFIESMERIEVITDQPEHGDTEHPTEVAMTSFAAVNNEPDAIKEEDNEPFKFASMAEDAMKLGKITINVQDADVSHTSDQDGTEFSKINIKLEKKQYDTLVYEESVFCSLGIAEALAPERGKIKRNLNEVEVLTDEENNSDSHEGEKLDNVINIDAGYQHILSEDDEKLREVAELETITSEITGTNEENDQATIENDESGVSYVLEAEIQLESDENNNRADDQSGMTEINDTSEIIYEIGTSQSSSENKEIDQVTVTEDEVEASDSSENDVEHEVHWDNLEEPNQPCIFRNKTNLAEIDQEIGTSQRVTEKENHQTTPALGEIQTNVNRQREAEVDSEFNDQEATRGLSPAKDGLEAIAENLRKQSVIESEENHQAMLMENVAKENFEKEAEVKREQQRKVDEAKEKERERLAVERAIREARERAFAEARDRAAAGKANADARRRVMAGARERSGKNSAETTDKPTAGKVSIEARLKSQRAAVERATTEARERALEKAMSEKTISEARNLADRIVAEKLSSRAGDSKMKKSFSFDESQPKGSCSSSSFRHANSFNIGGPDSSEREGGSAGESVQRCKARLERHQRTVERVAKALAEKNIRDILAQKEREERNRIAEILDMEVKRWSSGKEGNLRALLSTLQYILGHDSGWQPIPLTDIITTTAVKRAYRKATLSVHPDKLQQRGASIQQKYICEKVFDLLKAAWNRFNMEER